MIDVELPRLGAAAVAGRKLRTRLFASTVEGMVNAISGALGRSEKYSFRTKAEKQFQELEDRMVGAATLACENSVERLRQAMPVRTGATRDGWTMTSEANADTVRFTITHPNGTLVDWLDAGTRPHVIYARNARMLHFTVGGKDVFTPVVNHPGTKGLGFLASEENTLQQYMDKIASVLQ